jgi:hypothetical protein
MRLTPGRKDCPLITPSGGGGESWCKQRAFVINQRKDNSQLFMLFEFHGDITICAERRVGGEQDDLGLRTKGAQHLACCLLPRRI